MSKPPKDFMPQKAQHYLRKYATEKIKKQLGDYLRKEVVSKINEGPENSLNTYQSPSGTRIKKGCLILLRQPLSDYISMRLLMLSTTTAFFLCGIMPGEAGRVFIGFPEE